MRLSLLSHKNPMERELYHNPIRGRCARGVKDVHRVRAWPASLAVILKRPVGGEQDGGSNVEREDSA